MADELLKEVRLDVKELRHEVGELKTQIALITASLENKTEESKIKANMIIACIGLFGGVLGSALTALLGG